jgi:serine phosphatase RsbU (regulator of sigma subunit)
MIYTLSESIQDRPGGELDNEPGKKFLSKNLVKLLTEISPKPLAEQRDIIDNTITQWRNGRPQVDDITMIGLRI